MLRTGNQLQRRIKVKSSLHCCCCCSCCHVRCTTNLFTVVQALIALVNDPEPEHPLRADLAEEFLKDRKKFLKNAEEFTKKHAEKRRESSSSNE